MGRKIIALIAEREMKFFGQSIDWEFSLKGKKVIEHFFTRLKKVTGYDEIKSLVNPENASPPGWEEALSAVNIPVQKLSSGDWSKGMKAWVGTVHPTDQIILLTPAAPLFLTGVLNQFIKSLKGDTNELQKLDTRDWVWGLTDFVAFSPSELKRFSEMKYMRGQSCVFHFFWDVVSMSFWSKAAGLCLDLFQPDRTTLRRLRLLPTPEGKHALRKIADMSEEDIIEHISENRLPLAIERLAIEPTNECDLRCVYCPNSTLKRRTGFMNSKTFENIIDTLAIYDNLEISLSMYGEPLLHPEIITFMEKLKERKLNELTFLYTNGIYLNQKISSAIIENNLGCLFVSLDVYDRETYKNLKPLDEFEKVLNNFKEFLELKKQSITFPISYKNLLRGSLLVEYALPVVALQVIKMDENEKHLDNFFSDWGIMETFKKKSNTFFEFTRLYKQLQSTDNPVEKQKLLEQTREQRKVYLKEFYETQIPLEFTVLGHFNRFSNRITDRTVMDVTPLTRFACRKICPTVFWNGDMSVCPQDAEGELVIGNVNDTEFYELWFSDRAENLRQKISTHPEDVPICKDCKEWYYAS